MSPPPKPRTATPPPLVDGAIWIPLTMGKFALVDLEDAIHAGYAWTYSKRHGYAFRRAPNFRLHKSYHLRLHREVLGVTDPKVKVDHRNGDRLDCRRHNLRPATNQQNVRNNRGKAGRVTAPFKGVYPSGRPKKPWAAKITVDMKTINLGRFVAADDAARAYDAAARRHFGEFACTNFKETT